MEQEDVYVNYIRLLKDEYKETFGRIDIYIASHGLVVDNTSEIMEDVLDLLLTAQENHVPIENIIGKDFEKFCNQLIESHKESIVERFLSYFQWFRYIALLLGILELIAMIFDYLDGVEKSWNIPVEVGNLCASIIISFFIAFLFNILRKKLVLKKWYTPKLDTVFVIFLVVFIIISCFFGSDYLFSFILIPRFLFIPLTFIFFIFMTIRKRKQKKENHRPSFYKKVHNKMIEDYRKEYEKYQKKQENHIDVKTWYEKKYKKELFYQIITNIILVIILLGFIIFVSRDSEMFDTIIFIIIITCIEIPIFSFFNKGNRIRKNIYNEIKKKNTDIYDDSLFQKE